MVATEPLREEARPRLARVDRPGVTERLLALVVVLFLTVGFPLEWFNPPAPGDVAGGDSTLVAITYLGLAGPLFLFLVGNFHVAWRAIANARWVVALHVLMLASTVWSVDAGLTMRRSVGLVVTLLVAVHLLVRFNQLEIFRMFALALLFGVLVNLAFLAAFPDLSQTVETRSGATVITGVYGNKNGFGQLAFLAVFVFAVSVRSDRRRRAFWFIAALAAAFLLAQSESKTALATAGMGVVILLAYQAFRARRTLFGAVLLSVTGGAAGSIVFVVSNLEFTAGLVSRDASLSGRVPLWETLLVQIAENPVLGVGWSAFWNGWFSPAHEVWLAHRWLPPGGHNQFIDFALDLGLVGACVAVGMFGRALRRGTFVAQSVPGIYGLWPLGVVTIAIVYSMSETLVSRNIFWLMTVMALIVIDQPLPDRGVVSGRHQRVAAPESEILQ